MMVSFPVDSAGAHHFTPLVIWEAADLALCLQPADTFLDAVDFCDLMTS